MNSLEDGTALLATLGLDWFLAKGSRARSIKERDLRAASTLQNNLKARFRAFLDTPTFSKPAKGQLVTDKELAEVRDEVVAFASATDLMAARLSYISDPTYRLVVGDAVNRAVAVLRDRIPPAPRRGDTAKTGDFKSASFMRAYRTLSQPLSLVDDMEVGYLCRDQVDTLAEVFPALYEDMATALLESVIEREAELGAQDGTIIPYKKLKQIAVMLRQPLVSEDLKGLLAQNYSQTEQEQSASPGKSTGGQLDVNPGQSLTQLQKREFKE